MEGVIPDRYLTFKLGAEEYGLPLARVREILALPDVTPVPLLPDHVRGVMNLRSKLIPVIDLRRKLGMQPTPDHARKCVIVVEVKRGGVGVLMSIVVDNVSEVLGISADQIEKPPSMNEGIDVSFIEGMARARGGVKILLAIDAVLATTALAAPPSSTLSPANP